MTITPPPLPEGHRTVHLAETSSTNTEVMRLGALGEDSGLWVMADRQTAGKGRAGRSWASLEGNLQTSMLLRLHEPPHRISQLALVSGVALHAALADCVGPDNPLPTRLKWPNDVLIDGKKTGGILIESAGRPGTSEVIVAIGIGLNLTAHPSLPDRAATNLNAHGAAIAPAEMLAFLAVSMQEWLGIWKSGQGFSEIRSAWLQRCGPLGEQMSINTGAGVVTGRFMGLDGNGALQLADSAGRPQAFTFGDVFIEG